MNLVGKIFVVVLFVQSLVFMAFAVCVYGTHRSWEREIYRPKTETDPGGYAVRLDDAEAANRNLENEKAKAENKTLSVQASMTQVIAKLEAENIRLFDGNKRLSDKESAAVVKNLHIAAAMRGSQDSLKDIVEELVGLRESIKDTKDDRNDQFGRVVVLTDFVHQLLAQQDILAERNMTLIVEVTRYKDVLKTMNIPLPAVGDTPEGIVVNGVVLAVGREDLLEISIGSDDGVKQGLQLHVYRKSKYLGEIKVLRTTPDKSVARIDKTKLQGPIQKGDRVASKI